MWGVAELTLRKMKEPAFFIMVGIALLMGYCVSEVEPLGTQASSDSIIAQIVVSSEEGSSLLTSSFFAFALSVILAIFTGATEIPRDIESGMIMLVLSKPVRKYEYMLGKYFGVLILCLVFFAGSEIVMYLSHALKTKEFYGPLMMLRQFYLAIAFIPLVAITVATSCFFNDLSAMIVTAVYILFSLALNFIPIMVAILPKGVGGGVESYLFILYYFFPNYVFYFQTFKLFGVVPISLLLYSLSIAAVFLCIGAIRLKNRDLSPNAS